MKKLKIPHEFKGQKFWMPVLVVLLLAQSLALGIVVWHQNILWHQINNSSGETSLDSVAAFPIKAYIQSAVSSLYNLQTADDVANNLVYLPEAKISLPMNAQTRSIRYAYFKGDNQTPAQVQITTNQITSHLINKFSDVTCVQNLVGFSIDNKNGFENGGSYGGSVTLADGRTIYLWSNEHTGCNNFWGNSTQSDLLNALKQAKSY